MIEDRSVAERQAAARILWDAMLELAYADIPSVDEVQLDTVVEAPPIRREARVISMNPEKKSNHARH